MDDYSAMKVLQYRREENIGECLAFCTGYDLKYDTTLNEYRLSNPLGNSVVLKKGDYLVKSPDGQMFVQPL